VAGPSEHRNEPSGSTTGDEFLLKMDWSMESVQQHPLTNSGYIGSEDTDRVRLQKVNTEFQLPVVQNWHQGVSPRRVREHLTSDR